MQIHKTRICPSFNFSMLPTNIYITLCEDLLTPPPTTHTHTHTYHHHHHHNYHQHHDYRICHFLACPIFDPIFLHCNLLREAVLSRKIHAQIMRFTRCLNMAFTSKSLNWALICMHDATLECVAAVTDHFADAFFRENVAWEFVTRLKGVTITTMTLWWRNDVRKRNQV